MDYRGLQKQCEDIYTANFSKFSEKTREKKPSQLRPKYCYSCAERFNFKPVTPTTMDKDRNECSTSQTVIDFFNNTFTEKVAEGVPEDLSFNADEMSADIGQPRKVLIPPNEKRGTRVNEFSENSHVTAMVTINVAGEMFPPFLILPLAYLPRNISPMVIRGQMNIGGPKMGT